MKSSRNKTIDIDISEGAKYLKRCVNARAFFNTCILVDIKQSPATSSKQSHTVSDNIHQDDIIQKLTDKTILGNSFDVMKHLPSAFADLIIADPPYNLDKDFNGKNFKRSSDSEYATYTEEWLKLVHPLLKETGTLYVCCDWRSSPVIYEALQKYFIVRNRITWEREKGRGAKSNWKNSMEDIWFATKSDNYTFNLDAVKLRRRVVAPYKVDGKPKDWEETKEGNFRNTHPSNFWDDISVPYWSMPENTAHPTQKPEKVGS